VTEIVGCLFVILLLSLKVVTNDRISQLYSNLQLASDKTEIRSRFGNDRISPPEAF
jgi:hypothetical protein